jgi:cytochrome c553
MKNHLTFKILVSSIVLVTVGILVGCGSSATATPVPPTAAPTAAPTDTPELAEASELTGDLVRGGQLYDEWWAAPEEEEHEGEEEHEHEAAGPESDHPLWKTQTTNTRSGADTWRCKECHGWDYKGADGAYGSGSHVTGFAGILGSASKSADELAAWLNGEVNPDHDFSALGDVGVNALVTFIQEETHDVSRFINDDKSANGDPAQGKSTFENTCAACHGRDGKAMNFGDADEPEYVGTIARDNPWEFMHKAWFGQPGEPMPAGMRMGWSLEDIADLLAYAQTLPFE